MTEIQKIALVTGASRGLGAALAEDLAGRGYHVLAVARTVGALEELDDRIRAAGGAPATLAPMDVIESPAMMQLAGAIAGAAIDHIRDWALGSNGDWVTMGVPSDGSYGIPEGVMFGFPVTTENAKYTIVKDLPIDDFSRKYIDITLAELEEERAGVADLLG